MKQLLACNTVDVSSVVAKKNHQGHQAFVLCSCKNKAEIPHPKLILDILLMLVKSIKLLFFNDFVTSRINHNKRKCPHKLPIKNISRNISYLYFIISISSY